jgi:hypothetical protein
MRALRIAIAALALLVVHCGGEDDDTDAGDPWKDCGGSHGAKLSCSSYRAHHVVASHYDRDRHCFMPARPLKDLCAVPTYCPGGGGAATCFAAKGEVYAGEFIYGEELTNPDWHHSANDTDSSTLTDKERVLCDELGRTIKAASGDAGTDAGTVLIDTLNGFEVAPVCPD